MNDTLHIWHHMGMGDFLIANGIVRHYAEKWKNVVLFYKDPNKANVERLYNDLDNISFKDGGIHEDHLAKGWVLLNPMKPLLKIRLETALPPGQSLESYFYGQAGLPVSHKWEKFHFNRDMDEERRVYHEVLGLEDGEDYVFAHLDWDKDVKEFPDEVRVVRPDNMDVSLFDYLYVMERAREVHVMGSSFYCLIDCIQLQNDRLFYHEYMRGLPLGPTNLNWNVIR